jgi:hypothetical protein
MASGLKQKAALPQAIDFAGCEKRKGRYAIETKRGNFKPLIAEVFPGSI